jgi:hypothetical protein
VLQFLCRCHISSCRIRLLIQPNAIVRSLVSLIINTVGRQVEPGAYHARPFVCKQAQLIDGRSTIAIVSRMLHLVYSQRYRHRVLVPVTTICLSSSLNNISAALSSGIIDNKLDALAVVKPWHELDATRSAVATTVHAPSRQVLRRRVLRYGGILVCEAEPPDQCCDYGQLQDNELMALKVGTDLLMFVRFTIFCP